MARRRTALALRPAFSYPRTPAPIVIRQSAPMTKHKGKRRSVKAGGITMTQAAVTGLVLGLAEKSGIMANLPTVPLIGKKGLAALGLAFYSRHGGGKWAKGAAVLLAGISAYQYGSTGAISGED